MTFEDDRSQKWLELDGELEEIQIEPKSFKEKPVAFLRENVELFAWTAVDMPRIDLNFMSHHLSIFLDIRPMAQKRRKMNLDKAQEAQKQVQVLLDAGFIREVTYPT